MTEEEKAKIEEAGERDMAILWNKLGFVAGKYDASKNLWDFSAMMQADYNDGDVVDRRALFFVILSELLFAWEDHGAPPSWAKKEKSK
jgi:hypothetical protein